MQLFKLVMMAILLLGSSTLFAHEGHIVPPSSGWMHLLAHYWPVGLLGIVIWSMRGHLYRPFKLLGRNRNDR
jgi:hypothetical protein